MAPRLDRHQRILRRYRQIAGFPEEVERHNGDNRSRIIAKRNRQWISIGHLDSVEVQIFQARWEGVGGHERITEFVAIHLIFAVGLASIETATVLIGDPVRGDWACGHPNDQYVRWPLDPANANPGNTRLDRA